MSQNRTPDFEPLDLKPGVTSVWTAPSRPLTAEDLSELSEDERHRASTWTSLKRRQDHLFARWMLRRLLGSALGTPGRSLDIQTTAEGKPILPAPAPVHFSYSHSHEHLAFALSLTSPVGVDIEVPSGRDFQPLLRKVLHTKDPSPSNEREFLKIWTHKEALVKMSGAGLAMGFTQINITGDGRVLEAPDLQTLTARAFTRDTDLFVVSVATQDDSVEWKSAPSTVNGIP